MRITTNFSLRDFNTFKVESIAARYVRFDTQDEITGYLARHRLADHPHLVLGGGSNLLFVDDFDGIVLHPVLKGIDVIAADDSHIWLKAMAGEIWDDLVAHAVAKGWGGIENLSLIPGSVGASVVQNIGAYGMEVKDVIDRVEAISLIDHEPIVFSPADCRFGYRFSNFKGQWAGQFIITAVVFKLSRQPAFVLGYSGVREAVARLGETTLQSIRNAIIGIRKGRLPDPATIGNAGSFFKNPVVAKAVMVALRQAFPDLPHYPQDGNRFKLAAGWLIERCGWKGRQVGRVAVHDKQALVLVNLGGASGREIYSLSERVRASVQNRFHIDLEREVSVVPPGHPAPSPAEPM
jgi:UDP-N-acetylmuramate dehydrogenase